MQFITKENEIICIENDKEELTRICWETAHKLYGEKLPEVVEKRVEKELNSIIGNKFAPIYYSLSSLFNSFLE